ncbi:MAG: NAD(+)/NADH kinase [Butyrivibrio sp.]|nr:NAD(+)/NADH kinase [Butyrivibrio sp.]MBQ6407301.1 NAD(+)/NADH kinase [Butyrivibrio sp.]
MERFVIVTNKSKDKDLAMTMYIKSFLEERGKTCVIADKNENNSFYHEGREFLSSIPEDAECVIVLGGDGTMLQAARSAAYHDIPLIGVNMGTMGYLAEVEKSGVDEALSRILSGDYDTQERMMLFGSVGEKSDYALNDIVITRNSSMQMNIVNFDIYVNDLFLCNYHADGIIISTPTGSTGYNMSAGGPIVEPSANLILITPICPHTLNSRSMVLPENTKIRIVIKEGRDNRNQEVVAFFDGSGKIEMSTGDSICIEKSAKITKIIKLNRVSFLEVLGKKFDK